MRIAICAVALLALVAAACPARTVMFDVDGGETGFSLSKETDSYVEMSFKVARLGIEDIDVDGGLMQQLTLPGVILPGDEGAPNLPGFGRYVALPEGARPVLEVVSLKTETIDGLDILPAPPIPFEGDDSPLVYEKDPTIYSRDAFYPERPIRLSDVRQLRGVDVVILGITPFQYNPVTRELVVYTEVDVRVRFEGGTGRFGEARLRSRYWEPILAANVVNYASLPSVDFAPSSRDDEYEYVIIVPDDPTYVAWADSLKRWRTLQGIDTGVVTLTETGATSAAIEAWVDNAYNTWATPPAAVLLLADYVPDGQATGITCPSYSYYYTCVSDNHYADVDGDHLPDIAFARMTATPATIETLVRKVIDYERNPSTNPNFYEHPVVACGWQDDRWFTICTEIVYGFLANVQGKSPVREYAIYSGYPGTEWSTNPNTYMLVDYFGPDGLGYIPETPEYLTDWGGNATRLNADLNAGAFILQHRDHGSETGWGEPDYGIPDLSGLSNQDLPFVFSINCLTGKYNYSGECFAEAFHRYEPRALGLIAASETSMSFVNDTFVFGIYDCLWPEFDPGYPAPERATGPANLRPCFANASGKYYLEASNWPYNPEDKEATYYLFHMHGDAFTTLYSEMPVTYEIDPSSVPINKATGVTVTVWDDEGYPKPDVAITIDGWGIESLVDTTDGSGEAHFTVLAPYGEDLTVVGRELGESYNCLEDELPVTGGVTFGSVDIDASVESIGLYGSLAPYYEGLISGTASVDEFTLYAVGCGVDSSAWSGISQTAGLLVTPTGTGTISAAIGKSGYEIYLEDISVEVVYGQLSGEVYESGGGPIEGAVVRGYASGADTSGVSPLFEAVSGADGAYEVEGDLEVGYYDVYVKKFGYEPYMEGVFIQYGANDEDFYLEAAPSGVVSGLVTEVGSGRPLEATVRVYRADNMELYAEVTSDTLLGGYYEVTLPYFNYEFNVRAYHHIPESRGVVVESASQTEDFELEPTLANILLVDDYGGSKEAYKVDKSGAVLSEWSGGETRVRSAAQLASDLVGLGYDVTEETSAATDPGTWLDYDFVLWSDGDDTSPVSEAGYRTALEEYVAAGGKLLIEGGELAYDAASYPGYPTFAANVLHVSDWDHDSSGDLTVYDDAHPLTTWPNELGAIGFSYSNYGDQDAGDPTADALMVTNWSEYPENASVIVYDDNPDPASGQIVFFMFDYLAADAAGRVELLENAVTYLTAEESTPTGSISGQVCLEGEGDHSGVEVRAYPGGNVGYTDAQGYYTIEGLYAATYTVRATKAGWSTAEVEGVVVEEGQETGGVTMMLYPVTEYEVCDSPELSIPDDVPSGVYDTLTLGEDVTITEVEVYVNLTHTYIGDLIVEVTSPEGTTVRLHNRTGSSADDIVGWYDSELSVDGPGSLSDFVGESSGGEWTIWVSDNAGMDVGVLHTWCVHVWGGQPTGVPEGEEGAVPARYVLELARPNPFNPMTEVVYGLPEAACVTLGVYDVSGRLVRVLAEGEMPAGYHRVRWDGRDEAGRQVASGVYFCRVQAGSFSDATKMVLLK